MATAMTSDNFKIHQRDRFKFDFKFTGKILCVHAEIDVLWSLIAIMLVSIASMMIWLG